MAQPAFELIRLTLVMLGLAIALTSAALAVAKNPIPSPSIDFLAIAGVVLLFVSFVVFRYLGSLSRIMEIAAWSDEGAMRVRRDMEIGMRNEVAYETLIELYRPIVDEINQDLERRGADRRFEPVEMASGSGDEQHRYAAVALPTGRLDSLESLMGSVGEESHHRFRKLADSRQRLMRKWREMDNPDRAMEDEQGDNYCLSSLRIGGARDDDSTCLGIEVATYGEIVRSCEALVNEFALFAYLTGPLGRRRRPSTRQRKTLRMSPAAMLRCLPWRNRVHRENRARPRDFLLRRLPSSGKSRAADLFLRPRDRAAGVGIAVVTLHKKGGVDYASLGIRSNAVGTYPATHHVVPAGMCNTYATDFEARWDKAAPPTNYLQTTMQCEFLEEWFGREDLEGNKRRNWEERVKTIWALKKRAVEEPLALTGIAFDLLNLRPEICATTVVDTSEGELNWEFDKIGIEAPLSAMGRIRPTEVVQSGAAALMLAQRSRSRSNRRASAEKVVV
jgi:hypothetical protein